MHGYGGPAADSADLKGCIAGSAGIALSALYRLEHQGLIATKWGKSENNVGVIGKGEETGRPARIVRDAVAATVFRPAGAGEPPAGLVVGLAALVLACAMAVACYRPVRKAAAVDPAVALRAE